MKRNTIVDAAMGLLQFDLVISNVQFVNVHTKEIYTADIGIKDGFIAHVTQPGEEQLKADNCFDATGKYAVPGLIDFHMHIESSMLTSSHFTEVVLPHGTTTAICDPHEFCNVLGVAGMDYFLESTKNMPIHFLAAASSCVPSVVGKETSKTVFQYPEVAWMLQNDRVIALAEVMDFPGTIHQGERITEILEIAKKSKKMIQGHAPGLRGRELSAYMAAGVQTDHEARELDEAIQKLRAGLLLECRQASNYQNMPVMAQALIQMNYPHNAVVCTDDREVDDLLHHGHIDFVVQTAIQSGLPPIEAIKLATVNAALYAGLHDRGALDPGKMADIVLLDDLQSFTVNEVFVGGVLMAQNKKMCKPIEDQVHYVENQNTMLTGKTTYDPKDFLIPCLHDSARINGIVFNPEDQIVTKFGTFKCEVKDGFVEINNRPDLCTLSVIERHGINGNQSVAPVQNFNLKYGAIAGTVAHDCHNLFVFGKNAEDMAIAANHLIQSGGGFVCVHDKKITSSVDLPVAGLVSKLPAAVLSEQVEQIKDTIRSMGITANSPLNMLAFFVLAVFPEIRLTDVGLIDTLKQIQLPILVTEA